MTTKERYIQNDYTCASLPENIQNKFITDFHDLLQYWSLFCALRKRK